MFYRNNIFHKVCLRVYDLMVWNIFVGILWIVSSHDNNVRFEISVEKGLMSKDEAMRLVGYAEDEINFLSELIANEKENMLDVLIV